MYIAYDGYGVPVSIDDANQRFDYFCPICLSKLIVKNKGVIRAHHFAHKGSASECSDNWENEKIYDEQSLWHKNWQDEFPIINREITLSFGEVKHRADIVVDQTVIEFQHSYLSHVNYDKRTNYYHDCGCKVIWLFDLQKDYAEGSLVENGQNSFIWKNSKRTFDYFDNVDIAIELFFQLLDSNNDNKCIIKIKSIQGRNFDCFEICDWFSKDEFLIYVGKTEQGYLPPNIRSIDQDPEYQEFKKRYNLNFNMQQERAIQRIHGATLLLAVPGSGKTTTLIGRLGYMTICKGINPENILSITYTKASARHMKEEFCKKFGRNIGNRITFKTINAFCNGVLREIKQERPLCDKTEKHILIREFFSKLNNDKSPQEADIINAENLISFAKNQLMKDEDIDAFQWEIKKFPEIYKEYNRFLRAEKKIDYDDQILFVLCLFKQNAELLNYYQGKYKFICVDEVQDTSKLQHELLRILCEKNNNIFLVGDEDQSIYGFRGAFPQALFEIRDYYSNPFILKLETNYRSNQEIVEIANHFISKNMNRVAKDMRSSHGLGGKVDVHPVNNRDEEFYRALEISQKNATNAAILYRNNESAIPLIDLLERNHIPYVLNKQSDTFFSNRIVKDICSFMNFALDHNNQKLLWNIYYKFSLGFSKDRVAHTCFYSDRNKSDLLDEFVEQATFYKGSSKYRKQMRLNAENFRAVFCSMKTMSPVDALDTIEALGYADYSKEKSLNSGILDLLKLIAKNTKTINQFLKRLEELETIIKNKRPSTNGIFLSTIHSAKGLEFDTVCLLDVFDGILPSKKSKDRPNNSLFSIYEEERRLFYVAITRAKTNLIILNIKDRESEFIKEIAPKEPIIPEEKHQESPLKSTTYVADRYLNPNVLINESTEEKPHPIDTAYINQLLAKAKPTLGSIETNALKMMRSYHSEGQLEEYIIALQDATIFACSDNFMILEVPEDEDAEIINELRSNANVRELCSLFFPEKKEILALTAEDLEELGKNH